LLTSEKLFELFKDVSETALLLTALSELVMEPFESRKSSETLTLVKSAAAKWILRCLLLLIA
jgi:hypothetical protein